MNDMQKERWLAAKLHTHDNILRPVLITIRSNSGVFYWAGGPSYSRDTFDILKEYDEKDYLDGYGELDYSKLSAQFCRDFPIPEDLPRRSAGWVAPDGKFFACHSQEHDSTAFHLDKQYYPEDDHAESSVDSLEKRGWIRFFYDGFIMLGGMAQLRGEGVFITNEQIDTLTKLAISHDDPEWKTEIIETIQELVARRDERRIRGVQE